MSSGFPGSHPDYLHMTTTNVPGRSIPLMNLTQNNGNNVLPTGYRSPLAGILADSSANLALRRPDFIGKRSLAEFQHHQQLQQQAAFFLRNVKPRGFNNLVGDYPSPEISSISSISSVSLASNNNNNNNIAINNNNTTSSSVVIPRYGVPVMQHVRQNMQSFNPGNGTFNGVNTRNSFSTVSFANLPAKQTPVTQEHDGKMMKRLQELEKELLLDDEEDGENNVSGVTNSEWSENIFVPVQVTKPETIVSPTSSSSSSCASSSASPSTGVCPTQLLADAAVAIADGKHDSAAEMLTKVSQFANVFGTPEQRLSFYMTSALRSRLSVTSSNSLELYGKDHILSTHMLYDKSLCFKLGFMAANAAIMDLALAEKSRTINKKRKIHVVDFDIGEGTQYVYLLKDIAEAREGDEDVPVSLRVTTFADFGNGGIERLLLVGDGLKAVASELGVSFSYDVTDLNLSNLNTTSLKVEGDEVLVVNLAFKLYKLPDESVTTENVRDEVLRRVKGLSPALVTVVEQDLNSNTASFETRVIQVSGYYMALMESLDAVMSRDDSDRVKIEEGLSRRMTNSVACEGKNRVERCEVFGKWRARMSMAGFELNPMSQLRAESLLKKVNSVTRVDPGFTAKEESGGISFGWMGRTLTVASAWH